MTEPRKSTATLPVMGRLSASALQVLLPGQLEQTLLTLLQARPEIRVVSTSYTIRRKASSRQMSPDKLRGNLRCQLAGILVGLVRSPEASLGRKSIKGLRFGSGSDLCFSLHSVHIAGESKIYFTPAEWKEVGYFLNHQPFLKELGDSETHSCQNAMKLLAELLTLSLENRRQVCEDQEVVTDTFLRFLYHSERGECRLIK